MSKVSRRTKGCKLIGRDGDVYYFVDSIFDHGDGFRGCTGFSVRPVSEAEYEWASDIENVAERLYDVWEEMFKSRIQRDCDRCDGYLDEDAGCASCGIPSLYKWASEYVHYEGIGHIMFDESHCCDASDAFERLGIKHECTDCIGCGRQFNKDSDYEELFDFAAWIGVRSFEAGHVSYEWAAKTIFGKVDG